MTERQYVTEIPHYIAEVRCPYQPEHVQKIEMVESDSPLRTRCEACGKGFTVVTESEANSGS